VKAEITFKELTMNQLIVISGSCAKMADPRYFAGIAGTIRRAPPCRPETLDKFASAG
jgi:hypothetical protein